MNAPSLNADAEAGNHTTAAITLRDDERQRCEVWTRVMGYHRPASSFNIGKQGEFNERRYFDEAPGKAC
jgi:hypothetical protein